MQDDLYKHTVVFDLDGTLVDSLDDIAVAANMGLCAIGIEEKSVEEVAASIGHGLGHTIEYLLPSDVSKPLKLKAISVGKTYYESHPVIHTKPFEGVLDMLSELYKRGMQLAVLSNKDQVLVVSVVQKLFGDFPWSHVYGKVSYRASKPSPDTLLYMANAYNSTDTDESSGRHYSETGKTCSGLPVVMVGDNNVDIYTAMNAHVPFIGAGWGSYSVDVVYDKAFIANSPSFVVSWVEEYWRTNNES